jgi:hypothetical protein
LLAATNWSRRSSILDAALVFYRTDGTMDLGQGVEAFRK